MRTQSFPHALVFLLLCPLASAQWVQTTGPGGGTVCDLTVSGTELFAGTYSGGVFRSTDDGTNWTAVNTGLTKLYAACLAVSGTDLFAGTGGDGVFLSTNNGGSWVDVNEGLTRRFVTDLVLSGTNLFAATDVGVFLSTNSGTSWTQANNGLTLTDVASLGVSDEDVFAGTFGGGIFVTTDNGTNWTRVGLATTTDPVGAFTVSGTNLFAGTWWSSGIFLSTNNGTDWTAVNNGLTSMSVSDLAVSGTSLFAGTYSGGVFLSTNNGASWAELNTDLTNNHVYSLAISGTNLFAGTDAGVWRLGISDILPITLCSFSAVRLSGSAHVMLEWKTMSEINNYGFLVEKDIAQAQQVFTAIPGSFRPGKGTTSVPQTYTFVDSNVTPGKWAYRLKQIDLDGTVHVFDPTMVDLTTTDARSEPAVPAMSSLHQNYPNPFNPSTTIRYGLSQRAHVTLTVFNALGQQIARLVKGDLEAGDHEVQFDGSRLAGGVYLYRIQAGDFVQTRKCALVK
jgi:hypothetical protein